MVIDMVRYQTVLIMRSKAIRITTEKEYLSVSFVLREAENVDQKNNNLKKPFTLKLRKDEKLNKSWSEKMECKTYETFISLIFSSCDISCV